MQSSIQMAKNTDASRLARRVLSIMALTLLGTTALGCGYSEEEMQAQIDKYNKLASKYQGEKDERAQAEEELAVMKAKVAKLRKKLEEMGMNLDQLSSKVAEDATEKEQLTQNLQELQAALEEYKKRAQQLERIQARFDQLREKLNRLVEIGLKVEIRHNRMVIRLPGDVLFDSGRTRLRKEGKEVIGAVAEVIRKDKDLRKRYFQVAGHTDDRPLKGGRFGDNWGLSAMRAREVLLYLIDPETGGLDPERLHVAGYADIDPVATNQTAEGREQNRRVELVVLPDVSEMLDLGKMADEPPEPKKKGGKSSDKEAPPTKKGSDKNASSEENQNSAPHT